MFGYKENLPVVTILSVAIDQLKNMTKIMTH